MEESAPLAASVHVAASSSSAELFFAVECAPWMAASSPLAESVPWMVVIFASADSGVAAFFAVVDFVAEAFAVQLAVAESRRTEAFALDLSESESRVDNSASSGPSPSRVTCRLGEAATTGVLAAAVGVPLLMSGRTAPSSGIG